MSGTTGNEVRVGTDLTPEDARVLTDEIRVQMDAIAPLVTRAYKGRAWIALGYESWPEYVAGEFGGPLRLGREDRKQVVAELRQAGLSTRGIGEALGVGKSTVDRDVAHLGHLPDQITGTDGKTYSAVLTKVLHGRAPTEAERAFAEPILKEVIAERWMEPLYAAVDDLRAVVEWARQEAFGLRRRDHINQMKVLVTEARQLVNTLEDTINARTD